MLLGLAVYFSMLEQPRSNAGSGLYRVLFTTFTLI